MVRWSRIARTLKAAAGRPRGNSTDYCNGMLEQSRKDIERRLRKAMDRIVPKLAQELLTPPAQVPDRVLPAVGSVAMVQKGHRDAPFKLRSTLALRIENALLRACNSSVVEGGAVAIARALAFELEKDGLATIAQICVEENGILSFVVVADQSKADGCTAMHTEEGSIGVNGDRQESRKWRVETLPSAFREEDFEVYKQYQMHVHEEAENLITRRRYHSFLVETVLPDDNAEAAMGSFHMRYFLDDRLVACGVLDVTPHYVSSVYLFYHPSIAHLSPGVLATLEEIKWTRQLRIRIPTIKYYTMGLYAHTCPKMKYKAQYRPCELLDAVTHEWVPYERCLDSLETGSFRSFASPQRTQALVEAGLNSARRHMDDVLLSVSPNLVLRFGELRQLYDVPVRIVNALHRFVVAAGFRVATLRVVADLLT